MNGRTHKLVPLVSALLVLAVLPVIAGGQAEGINDTGDAESQDQLTEVTLVLDWLPNTNHAGIYLAQESGYFADEGLAVEIVQPSELGAEQIVAGGSGDFGISHQEALTFARTSENPLPLVAIAALFQHNTSGYAAAADRGIEGPEDFAGKRYGGWGTEYEIAMLDAVMEPYGTSGSDVEVVNTGTMDFIVALQREIDFNWIFYGWDGVRADIEGFDLDYFPLTELDERLDYYTPVIVASESYLDENAETARAFLRALSRGYRESVSNPDAAAEALRNNAPEIGAEHARRGIEYLAPYVRDEGEAWGVMDRTTWEAFTGFLDEHGLLASPLDIDAAFTNDFLPEEG